MAANERLSQDLYDTVTSLVCSAPLAFDETRLLASFRMLDAAHRLMRLVAEHDELGDDPFLKWAEANFQENHYLAMTDQAAYLSWLSDYVTAFAKDALSRTGAHQKVNP